VEFPEGQFAIEIQRDESLLSRPWDASCLRHVQEVARNKWFCEVRKCLRKFMYLARCICRMNTETDSATNVPDPAAVFACALSLWQACQKRGEVEKLNLSECFNGMDELMRETMRIANKFEAWACFHIDFEELNEVWPYLLQDKFGEICLIDIFPNELASALTSFGDSDCLRAALRMKLPIIFDDKLPIPVDITALNPVAGSPFKRYRIQTVRDAIEIEDTSPYVIGDDPFDSDFESPYFSLYGVGEDGLLEFIADRSSYSEAVKLARKLAPGIDFPDVP
jgi:hypothetical protein